MKSDKAKPDKTQKGDKEPSGPFLRLLNSFIDPLRDNFPITIIAFGLILIMAGLLHWNPIGKAPEGDQSIQCAIAGGILFAIGLVCYAVAWIPKYLLKQLPE